MAQFLYDTFTEASDTPLENHTPDTGNTWGLNGDNNEHTVLAASNELSRETATHGIPVNPTTPPNAEYSVEVRGKTGGTGSTDRIGARVRSDTAALGSHTDYHAIIWGSTGVLHLYRTDSGTANLLSGSHTISGFSASTYYNVKLEVTDLDASTVRLKVYLDDALVNTQDDTSVNRITTTGNAGVYQSGTNSRIAWVDGNTLSSVSISNGPFTEQRGAQFTINGSGFGATQGTGTVTVSDGTATETLTIDSWADTTITATIPSTPASASGVKYGVAHTLTLTTDAADSTTSTLTLNAETGWAFVDVANLPAPDGQANLADETTGDVPANGDQVRYEAITGLTTNDDTTWENTANSTYEFDYQFWDATDSTWGAVGTMTVTDGSSPITARRRMLGRSHSGLMGWF